MRKNHKRSSGATLMIASAIVLSVCGLGGGMLVLGAVAQRAGQLPTTYQAAKKAGLAVDLSDLKVSVPPEEDAYPLVAESAKRLMKEDPKKIGMLGAVMLQILNFKDASVPDETFNAAQYELASVFEPLNRIRTTKMSVPKPEVRLTTKGYSPGVVLDFAIQLWCARSIRSSERRDLATAVTQIREAVRLLRLMESERGYLAFRRQSWSRVMVHRALVRMIQEMPDRPEVPQIARDVAEQLGALPSIRRHLGGELAIVLDAIKKRKKEDIEYLPFADSFKDMGRGDVIRIFTRAVEQMPQDPYDVDGARKALIQMESEGADAPIYGGYATGYRSMEFLVRDVIARGRLLKVALALLKPVGEGQTISSLPESLGEDRIDPHSGEPFRIKDTPDSLIVYCVGKDGYDDGGMESPPTRMGVQTRDIIFAIPKKGPRPSFQGPKPYEKGWVYQKDKFWR